MKNLICKGCGSKLQNLDENKPGFINKIDETKSELYCKRCYRLMHYNEFPKIVANNEDYELIVDDLLKKKGLIVLVVDLFDFTGSFIPKIMDKLRDKHVILVANKLDLLPKSVNVSNILSWLSYMTNRYFFRVDAIHIVSSKKEYNIDPLMNTIEFLRDNEDVYFMGCANVGKSSLINCLIKRFSSRNTDIIATSPIPGTTLSSINIPFFEDNHSFIDTPGLINERNALSCLNEKSYDLLLPKKEIKPISYQLEEGNCVILGAIFVAALVNAKETTTFTAYVSDNVTVHRRKNIDTLEFIEKHRGQLLVPPVSDDKSKLHFVKKIFEIKDNKQDLVISGLGFITINKPCTIEVNVIDGLDVFLRNAIFGK